MEASIQSGKSTQSGNNMEQCIQDCIACYQECISSIPYCLTQGGKHAEAKHITLMLECADLCNLSARSMHLKGQFAFELCQLCAKVCDECAKSCKATDMQKCADVCRKCAESRRNMGH